MNLSNPSEVLKIDPLGVIEPVGYTSPATDLALLRSREKRWGPETTSRHEGLINRKWRVLYRLNYNREQSGLNPIRYGFANESAGV